MYYNCVKATDDRSWMRKLMKKTTGRKRSRRRRCTALTGIYENEAVTARSASIYLVSLCKTQTSVNVNIRCDERNDIFSHQTVRR